MEMDTLAKIVLSGTRKSLLRRSPVFKLHARISPNDLLALERSIGANLPGDLRAWLLAVGYGDLDDELSFRKEWVAPIRRGQLKGGLIFAQDSLGNFYAYGAPHDQIYYLARSDSVFAPIAASFLGFMQELVSRDYKLADWMDALEAQKYDW
jgi:hypothetical protein